MSNTVKMSTKTFEIIAKVVREHEEAGKRVLSSGTPLPLADRFADELERHNPLFDRELFLARCDPRYNHNGDNHR